MATEGAALAPTQALEARRELLLAWYAPKPGSLSKTEDDDERWIRLYEHKKLLRRKTKKGVNIFRCSKTICVVVGVQTGYFISLPQHLEQTKPSVGS